MHELSTDLNALEHQHELLVQQLNDLDPQSNALHAARLLLEVVQVEKIHPKFNCIKTGKCFNRVLSCILESPADACEAVSLFSAASEIWQGRERANHTISYWLDNAYMNLGERVIQECASTEGLQSLKALTTLNLLGESLHTDGARSEQLRNAVVMGFEKAKLGDGVITHLFITRLSGLNDSVLLKKFAGMLVSEASTARHEMRNLIIFSVLLQNPTLANVQEALTDYLLEDGKNPEHFIYPIIASLCQAAPSAATTISQMIPEADPSLKAFFTAQIGCQEDIDILKGVLNIDVPHVFKIQDLKPAGRRAWVSSDMSI